MRQALQVGICWLWMVAAAQAADPAVVELTTSANTVLANFADTATLTAVVLDANGNPIANQMVTINASGSNNGVARRNGTTDSTGTFVTTIKSNVAQRKLVTASTGLLTAYQPIDFVPGAPALGRCQILASPKMSLVADGISMSLLTITAQDLFANPIPNVPITLSVSGSENTLSIQNGNSSDSGLFFSGLTSTHAETKTISALVGNLTVTTNVQFIGNSPNHTFSQFVITPNTPLAADQNQSFKLQVLVQDDHNNPIPNFPVAFGIDGTTARFDAADGYSTTAGTFTTGLRSASIGTKQIYVTAGEFTATQNVTFTVGVPRSGTSTVVAQPNALLADNNSLTTVTATVRDASGNPVPSIPIFLSVNGNRNTLSATNGNTDASGNFNVTLKSSLAETKSVTMVAGGATARGLVTFLPGQANALLSRFTVSPNAPVAANNSALFTFTTTIVDDFSNPVRLLPVTYMSTGPNDMLTDTDNLTSNAGVAYNTMRSTSVGPSTITMTAGGLTKQANVTFVLGAMSTSVSKLTASPNTNVIADMNHPVTLTATLKDIVGHVLANQNITVSSNGPNDVIATPNVVSDANGWLTTTLLASKMGTKTVYVSNGNQRIATVVQFIAGPAAQSTSVLTLAPNNVTADNRSITSVEADIFDAYQNPVRGVPVTFTVSDTNSVLSATSGTSNVTGTVLTTLHSTLATPKTVTATFAGLSVSSNVTFVPGSPSATTSRLIVSPNSNLLANNSDTASISVSLKDIYNNVTPNVRVLLSGQSVGNTFTPGTGLTDANGLFSSSVRASRAAAQRVLLSAGTASLSANVTFSPGPATQATSSIERSPYAGVTANGNAISTVIASLYDQWNNPIGGAYGTMTSSNANDVLSAASGNTTAQGTFTTTLKSREAGSRTITYVSGNVTLPIAVSFVAGAPSATLSSFIADMNSGPADNVSVVTMTTTLQDSFGNPITAAWVNFTASGSRYLFSPSGMSTDSSGVAQSTFRTASAGVRQLKAQTGSFALNTNVTFFAGSPNSNTTKVTANPNTNVRANGTTPVTLKAFVFDQFSNPVPNQSVTLTSDGNTDQIAAPSGTTDANGNYSTTLTSNDAGQKTITLTAGPAVATTHIVHISGSAAREDEANLRWARAEEAALGRARWLVVPEENGQPARVVAVAPNTEAGLRQWSLLPGGDVAPGEDIGLPFVPALVATGDFDGDGQAELLASDSRSGALFVTTAAGKRGTSDSHDVSLGTAPVRALAVTSATSDGVARGAALSADGQSLLVFARGERGHLAMTETVPLERPAHSLVLDATKTQSGLRAAVGSASGIELYTQPPRGGRWHAQWLSHVPARWMATSDIDGDEIADWLAVSEDGRELFVWIGEADGALTTRAPVSLPAPIRSAAVGDADGDGRVDVTLVAREGGLWHAALQRELAPSQPSAFGHAPAARDGFRWVSRDDATPLMLTYSHEAAEPRLTAFPR